MSRFLYPATYSFLALPYGIFFGGWFRSPCSGLLVALVLAGWAFAVRSALRDLKDVSDDRTEWTTAAGWWPTLWPLVVIVPLIGLGGVGFQDTDWLRGNAVVRDLVTKPWPVVYGSEESPILLTYYTAFYLPPAIVGKWLGWTAANVTMFMWGTSGLVLCGLWLLKLTRRNLWWTAAVFFAFSGMDALGIVIRHVAEIVTGAPTQSWKYMEWWAGYGVACYPANLDLLVYAPNQALPAWMLTAMILNDARAHRLQRTGAFYLGLSTLWAPYVAIGLLPFVLVLIVAQLKAGRLSAARVRELFSGVNIVGIVMGLMVTAYFASRFGPYVSPIDLNGLHQERLTLTLFREGPRFLLIYPLFVVLEFGLLHALLYYSIRKNPGVIDPPLRTLLVLSTLVLCALPWINLSWNNDIVMRASIPMLVVTALVSIAVLGDEFTRGGNRRAAIGILIVLSISWINVATIIGRQVTGIYRQGSMIAVPDEKGVLDLFELQDRVYNEIGYNFAGQYLGSLDTLFGRHLLGRPEVENTAGR